VQSVTHPAFAVPALVAASRFVFAPAEIDYAPAGIRIEYRYVFTPEMPEPDAIAGEPTRRSLAEQPINLAGRVLEAGLRKPIPGAVVHIAGRPVAETDNEGRFTVRGLIPGELAVRITGPYHDTYEVKEALGENERLEVKYYLLRTSFDPYETVVRAKVRRREVAKIQLERKELEKIPGTFGDPVRVIENLPGMARTPLGLGGALLVRGANPTESKVYVDGIEVPLIFHFGGLTSIIAAGFLERIDFYPGGFGVRFGNATAGIVDVATRELDCDAPHGYAKADLVDAAAYTCVPAGDWQLAAAARRSYIDVLLPYIIPVVVDTFAEGEDVGTITLAPYYWDYQVKAQGKPGPGQVLDLFLFGSHDRLEAVTSGSAENINYDTGIYITFHRLIARHKLRLSDRLLLTSTLSPAFNGSEANQTSDEIEYDVSFRGAVWQLNWREDLAFEVSENLQLNLGIDTMFARGNFAAEAPIPTALRVFPKPTFDYTDTQKLGYDVSAYNHAYHAEAVWEPGYGLKIVSGLRIDRWDMLQSQSVSVQPRVTTRWDVTEGITVKGAYGLYEKSPEPVYLMERPLGNPGLPPLRSHHFIVGYEQIFSDLVSIDVQGFYNLRRRIPAMTTQVRFEDDKRIPEVYAPDGRGSAYGLELLVRHLATENGWFYGWIAYTLSRSIREDRIPDITYSLQGGGDQMSYVYEEQPLETYLSPFDQTHILTIVGQFVLPLGFEAGLRFRLVSGSPYTRIEDGRVYYDTDADKYRVDLSGVKRNSSRMPAFHQLDVRVDKTFVFDLFKFSVYLEVINAYNASNVEQYLYDYRYVERRAVTLLPIIPVLGVRGEF